MKGFRVLGFNILSAVLTVLVAYNWADVLPPAYGWAGAIIVSVGNFALRFVTTTPVGQSS